MKASGGKTDSPKATSIPPRQAASATPSIPAPRIPARLVWSWESHSWQLISVAAKELLPELSDGITSQDLVNSNTGMSQTFLYCELHRQGETTAEVSALISAFPSTCLLIASGLNCKVQTAGVWLGFTLP